MLFIIYCWRSDEGHKAAVKDCKYDQEVILMIVLCNTVSRVLTTIVNLKSGEQYWDTVCRLEVKENLAVHMNKGDRICRNFSVTQMIFRSKCQIAIH